MIVNTALGGLVGLLVGDALGVPYEFTPANAIPNPELLEYVPPVGFSRAHPGTPPGTWSDDGALALALLDALLDARHDHEACAGFSTNLLAWYIRGEFTPDGRVFDVGGTTISAINRLRAGEIPLESGLASVRSNGNGSLMRTLPVALVDRSAVCGDNVIRLAMRQSCVTHRHPLSQVCCAVYACWAHLLGNLQDPAPFGLRAGRELAFNVALERVYEYVKAMKMAAHLKALQVVSRAVDEMDPTGTGFVLDTLLTARSVIMNTATFEDAVKVAICYGNDTDTTACVVGGLAGLIYGYTSIPQRWVKGLQGQQVYGELARRLVAALPEGDEHITWEKLNAR